jgi:hypothetical protein
MKINLKVAALLVGMALASLAQGQTANSNSNSGAGASTTTTANPVNVNMGTGSSTSSSGSQAGANASTTGNAASLGVTVQQDFSVPGRQDVFSHQDGSVSQSIDTRVSGTTTLKNVPNVVPPNILPTSPCMGSTSIGGSVAGFGLGGGTSWKDADCGYRETARVFMQANRMDDGLAVLCASEYAAAAPTCKALVKKAADEMAHPVVANAKQEVIRTQNDAGRNATVNGTMSKSQFDKEITVALASGDKGSQCDVYRRAGDTILMNRMGCMGK